MKTAMVHLDCQPQPALVLTVTEAPTVSLATSTTDLTGGTAAAENLVGMVDWDALSSDQKARVNNTMRSFFLHQSVGGDLEDGAQSVCLVAISTLRAQDISVLPVTPPLVFNMPDENAPEMQMRTWMMSTISQDTRFDHQGQESTEPTAGAHCKRSGSWETCCAVRSTAACPKKAQGESAPSGQGHRCFSPHALRLAKAFPYAIYRSQS